MGVFYDFFPTDLRRDVQGQIRHHRYNTNVDLCTDKHSIASIFPLHFNTDTVKAFTLQ